MIENAGITSLEYVFGATATASPLLGILTAVIVCVRKPQISLGRRILAAMSLGIATFLTVFILFWIFILRDGLGPDAIRSTGWYAVEGMVTLSPALIIVLPPLLLGLCLIRDRSERKLPSLGHMN